MKKGAGKISELNLLNILTITNQYLYFSTIMKKLSFLSLMAITLLASTAFIGDRIVEDWTIDKSHSNITFSVRHFFTPVSGQFEDYQSEISFDPEDLTDNRIEITIPVASINTRNDRRDNHLKSEDFFNAEKWPDIRFVSESIKRTGDNQFVASGKLTIRDVTRNFDLPFEVLGVMDHPMRENLKVAGIVANAELNRKDYGVGVGDWAATAVVGNQIDIQISLELNSVN